MTSYVSPRLNQVGKHAMFCAGVTPVLKIRVIEAQKRHGPETKKPPERRL
jgi:hypothetical protein